MVVRFPPEGEPEPRKGSRASGTNPRALGTNPRALRSAAYTCTVCGRKYPGGVKAEVVVAHLVKHGLVELT